MVEFKEWRDTHPLIETDLRFPNGDDSGWGRINAKWHEKHDGIDLTHICAFTLDLQTGDIFLDCTKQKIWTKCLLLTLGRPLFGLLKTTYHLILPISIPVEIFNAIYGGITNSESAITIASNVGIRVWHNVLDIVRTPLYTVVLTVITLAAVIVGPFAPRNLFELRALAGRVENALTRGEDFWTLAPCFQPIANLMTIEDEEKYVKNDTEYDPDEVLHRLNNLARSYVNYRRSNRNPFDDYGRLHKDDVAYISPAYVS